MSALTYRRELASGISPPYDPRTRVLAPEFRQSWRFAAQKLLGNCGKWSKFQFESATTAVVQTKLFVSPM